eukprot:TRINITY_DN4362_c0_g1_i4.p1 TRINITY_DN4362_c0_g1~~TRINITY_DN4362_c0_g1_i4.p1  ORF type:complete len:1108 (-),score=247.18 TRINITY_DN4362_c0_g1_i4:1087-4044(-)
MFDRLTSHLSLEKDCSAEFLTLLRQLLSSLEQYYLHLSQLVKNKKLSYAVTTSYKRSKLEKLDATVYNDLKLALEMSGMITSTQQETVQRKASLSRIESNEGKEFWNNQFGGSDMNVIPWPIFIKGFRKKSGKKLKLPLEDEILLKHVLDSFNSGFITPTRFSDFLTLFGPISDCIQNLKSIYNQKWFGNFMSVEEVFKLLSSQPVGTFLVRFSLSRRDSFALEYVEAEGKIRTVLIQSKMPDGVYVRETDESERHFKSLIHFIEYYNDLLLKPYHSDFFGQLWFKGDVDIDDTNEMLAHCPPGTYLIHFHGKVRNGVLVCSYAGKNKTVKHIFLQKVRSGYIRRYPRGSSDSEDSVKELALSRNRSMSAQPLPSTKRFLNLDGEDSQVFPTIADFIRDHSDMLRYNYDSEGVPHIKFFSNTSDDQKEVCGPEKINEPIKVDLDDCVSAQTLSTYPKESVGSQVLCDAFRVCTLGNRTLFVLADGCSWGNRSREAAQCASLSFMETMAMSQHSLNDSTEVKHFLLRAFSKAHDRILQGHDDIWSAGTTTLLGGMLAPVEEYSDDGEFAFVCASVGDCKAFHWSQQYDVVTDVTYGNRRNIRDPRDCGGRIGPYLDGGMPDLRNLKCYFYPCKPGDLVLMMSDGIHDNLDPEHLGLSPADVNITNYQKWSDIPSAEAELAKSEYQCKVIKNLLQTCEEKNPNKISTALVEMCLKITDKSRQYMEANPNKPEPSDYVSYPGKMDHTTCIVITAPTLNMEELEKREKKEKKPLSISTSSKKFANKQQLTKSTSINPSSSSVNSVSSSPPPLNRYKSSPVPRSLDDSRKALDKIFFSSHTLKFINDLPILEFKKSPDSIEMNINRNESEKEKVLSSLGSAWSDSTLPIPVNEEKKSRTRNVLSDDYGFHVSSNRISLVLSSSSSTSAAGRASAECAKQSWLKYFSNLNFIENNHKLSWQVVEALQDAHVRLVEVRYLSIYLSIYQLIYQ